MNHPNGPNNKRVRPDSNPSRLSLSLTKKFKCSSINSTNNKVSTAHIHLVTLPYHSDNPKLFSSIIEPNRVYTIGRTKYADVIFSNPCVSKQHCQLLFDSSLSKLYLLNGALLLSHRDFDCDCIVARFRVRLLVSGNGRLTSSCDCVYDFKGSLNGVFVNGVKLNEGLVVELDVGDEVVLVCGGRDGGCGFGSRVGFIVRSIVYQQQVALSECRGFRLCGKVNKRVFALRVCDLESCSDEILDVVGRAKSLSAQCKHILRSCDPVSCILKSLSSYCCVSSESKFRGFEFGSEIQIERKYKALINGTSVPDSRVETNLGAIVENLKGVVSRVSVANSCFGDEVVPKDDQLFPRECDGVLKNSIIDDMATLSNTCERDSPQLEAVRQNACSKENIPPPVKNFYLNRLESLQQSLSSQQNVVSLPELLHPVSSISRMFIATFTSDIRWFLSYCDIPSHLPVIIASHSTERCWSSNPEKRSCVPYPDFPNLVVVYPRFPEAIAFGNDRKKQGVACHHPKLLVLQRKDSLRVIVTSANLNAKQWNNVTNTVWWQDFPCRNAPDWASLFSQVHNECANSVSKSDFAAQLAGFMATLLTDVPSQAYWIAELTKYDFSGANAYLVASVPGIHSHRSTSATIPDSMSKCSETFFGSVEASVVGLSHLFRTAADSNGVKLKRLAVYLGESSNGLSEIMLRRDKNIPADSNAVSVLVPDAVNVLVPDVTEFSKDDCVQLGFLPRTVAKWVSPLWDAGIFKFYGYVCPREALAAAFGENNKKVPLTLYVSQGPNFQDIPKMMEPELHIAFCGLIASIQRCTGVWRLHEVLHQYKWPEYLESDFIYGSSSIGTSIGAQFLSTFSSAAGKRSQQLFDSEESDPEWGCWNVSHELRHPSIKILFPTIERVKNAHSGILPSKTILCFSEKTWQRVKPVDILHDAVPYPDCRVGFPMHVKVARRRFKSKTDASSFGWLYCGSHNMSAAAWGRQLSGTGKDSSSRSRLHVCNYELGVIFVFPPPMIDGSRTKLNKSRGLDDIQLPFVVPAPKYRPTDRPATMQAMREAMVELAERGGEAVLSEQVVSATEEMVEMDEEEEEEDGVEVMKYEAQEVEEEVAYADVLWNQVDSFQSS